MIKLWHDKETWKLNSRIWCEKSTTYKYFHLKKLLLLVEFLHRWLKWQLSFFENKRQDFEEKCSHRRFPSRGVHVPHPAKDYCRSENLAYMRLVVGNLAGKREAGEKRKRERKERHCDKSSRLDRHWIVAARDFLTPVPGQSAPLVPGATPSARPITAPRADDRWPEKLPIVAAVRILRSFPFSLSRAILFQA